MNRTLLILPILALAGCAGPAKAQPTDPVGNERLSRLADLAADTIKEVAVLGEKITDTRFIELASVMAEGFQLTADRMAEDSDRQIADIARLEAKIVTLEEAARVPWWIIGSICLGGPAVGVGSYKAGGRGKNGSEA